MMISHGFSPWMFLTGMGLLFGLIIGLAALTVAILYLVSLMKTLNAVSPANRKMSPGLVFLLLIPFFNLVWNFFVVIYIRDSLKTEFETRGLEGSGFGGGIGLAMSILAAVSLVPFLSLLTSLAGFVCWILYWSQITGFRHRLETAT
jgi:hypothetical protein